MTNVDEIHVPIVHHTDLLIDHQMDEILALDIDHVHTPETENFRSRLCHLDLLLDLEILDVLDLDRILKQEINKYLSTRKIKFT